MLKYILFIIALSILNWPLVAKASDDYVPKSCHGLNSQEISRICRIALRYGTPLHATAKAAFLADLESAAMACSFREGKDLKSLRLSLITAKNDPMRYAFNHFMLEYFAVGDEPDWRSCSSYYQKFGPHAKGRRYFELF
jgi:hypothetical protein